VIKALRLCCILYGVLPSSIVDILIEIVHLIVCRQGFGDLRTVDIILTCMDYPDFNVS